MWDITEITQIVEIDIRRTDFISVICRDYSWPSLFKQERNKEKDRESLTWHLRGAKDVQKLLWFFSEL